MGRILGAHGRLDQVCASQDSGHVTARYREELETVLCGIESAINARPLTAPAVSYDPDDQRPLRPVDFLRCPTGDTSEEGEDDLRSRRRYQNTVVSHLWRRWQREYLRNLRDFQHASHTSEAGIGDLVLIEGDQLNRLTWKTGTIQQLHLGRDGRARAATLRTVDGDRRRPVQTVSARGPWELGAPPVTCGEGVTDYLP